MTPQPQHPQRCDKSCEHFDNSERTNILFGLAFCKKHSLVVEPIFQNQTKITGCASHSAASQQRIERKFNSTELLLLAHDEWKRREERKHNHEESAWIAGFLNGFYTDKKWAREYVDALLQAGDGK